ncbi:hypothetical protein B296_00005914 [Ensete ventricosum]|uniref:Uncharacterized protein n=1 Tax=Ensete ventricosum TaxID=4639 RepID=A0A427AQ19_ENSVE|nr:hypothetical protein B296_00005914 [Ensete ventricosum]
MSAVTHTNLVKLTSREKSAANESLPSFVPTRIMGIPGYKHAGLANSAVPHRDALYKPRCAHLLLSYSPTKAPGTVKKRNSKKEASLSLSYPRPPAQSPPAAASATPPQPIPRSQIKDLDH